MPAVRRIAAEHDEELAAIDSWVKLFGAFLLTKRFQVEDYVSAAAPHPSIDARASRSDEPAPSERHAV